MDTPSTAGRLFLGTLITAMVGMIALTAVVVGWPMWQDHVAMETVRVPLREHHGRTLDEAVDRLQKSGRVALAVRVLIEGLRSDDYKCRVIAAAEVGTLRADAVEATPALVIALADSDSDVRNEAGEALERIGDVAFSALFNGLKHESPFARGWCAFLVGKLPDHAEVTIPWLRAIAMDEHEDGFARKEAAVALANLDPEDDLTVKALVEVMANGGGNFEVINGIEKVGSRAIPELMRMINDESPARRRAAAYGIERLGKFSISALSELTELLKHEDEHVRSAAAHSLGQLGASAMGSVSPLIECLHDESSSVRYAAARSLCMIDADQIDAVLPVVVNLVNDPDWLTRFTAVELLKELGQSERIRDRLTEQLDEDDADARARAAEALGELGAAAAPAIESLRKRMRDDDPGVRVSAAIAVCYVANDANTLTVFERMITKEIDTTVPVVLAALRGDHLEARRRAVWAIGAFGAAAQSAIPLLKQAMKDSDQTVADGAKQSLERIERAVRSLPVAQPGGARSISGQ